MATLTAIVGAANNADAASYTTASFTPLIGDYLICNVHASGTTSPGYVVDDQNLGWTLLDSVTTGGNIIAFFVCQKTAKPYLNQVTWNCPDDPATGARVGIVAARGSDPFVRQTAKGTGLAGTAPAITFSNAILTANCCLANMGNVTNPAAITPTVGWTEVADAGWNLPTTGFEVQRINSGSTATTVTWASNSASNWMAMGIEIYDTATFPFVGTANIFRNDEVRVWLIANGFTDQYNDGLRQYFRTIYMDGGQTFQDLLMRYLAEFGETIPAGA